MPDPSKRSAEEREAARLERERRRAGQAPGAPARTHAPAPAVAHTPPPAWHEPAPDGDGDGDGRLGPLKFTPRGPRRSDERPKHSTRRRLLALIPLLLAVALAWFLIELFQPFHGSRHGHITVTIPPHSSSSEIGDQLSKDGVIDSSFFFELRATLAGERGDLRPGTYHLQLGMSYSDVLAALTKLPPVVKTTQVTLIPGKSRQQISALLRSQGIRGSYLAATRRSRLLNPRQYGAPRKTGDLEGFLFPSTYFVTEPIKVSQLVDKQLTAFKQAFGTISFRYARRHGLTPYDVLIVASIIEGETPDARDRPRVASVIYNRLRQRIPLQMDSSVRYAVDNYTTPITQSQLRSASPWNTYVHQGLPPTPIDNPSLASIKAAAHPANTKYLFFVAKPCGNGASLFASTYAQFQADNAKYEAARAKRGGRSPVSCH